MFRTGAKHSSSPASFQGPGTRYMEMFVRAGGIPKRSCVFLHDLATYTWRSSFRPAGYLGDLMLLHDLATSTWSCSFRLLGAVEIFPAFCSGRRIAGGRARLPWPVRAIRAIRSKIRAIPSHQNQENFRTSLIQRSAKGFLSFVQDWCEALFLPSLLSGSWHEIHGDVRSGWRDTLEILCVPP